MANPTKAILKEIRDSPPNPSHSGTLQIYWGGDFAVTVTLIILNLQTFSIYLMGYCLCYLERERKILRRHPRLP